VVLDSRPGDRLPGTHVLIRNPFLYYLGLGSASGSLGELCESVDRFMRILAPEPVCLLLEPGLCSL